MDKTLIITEKPSVARRIANALGKPNKKIKRNVPYFQIDNVFIVPAAGHLYSLREKNPKGWRYPIFEIDWAPIYKISKESKFAKAYIDNISEIARECKFFINACDFDTEGEVIAYNILRYACNIDPSGDNVKRMKFSTLTRDAILNSYRNLIPSPINMAMAGITRHFLDWFWGINLSRALTLAIRRAKAYTTLSIGRVQGPTLKILVEREREIQNFKPEPYWELEILVEKDKEIIKGRHINGKFWDKKEVESARKNSKDTATVEKISKRKITQKPPNPFDLTTLQTEAYRIFRITPQKTLEIAQNLYTNAYISYPRTSSQQLPKDINFRKIIEKLSQLRDYEKFSEELLSKERLTPNNGKKTDPAHPAIHPTGVIPERLSTEEKRIYDLICRRFLATFYRNAVRQSQRVVLISGSERFLIEGITTIDEGWHPVYKYIKLKEEEIPEFSKGETLRVKDIKILEKETTPPKRYTPSSIVREMEKKNLGTKATRSQIVDILFKRGYIRGESIEVTPLGMKVVETLDKYCPLVLSETLTRKFEREMQDIEEGKRNSEEVIEEGKNTILKISEEFKKNEKNIGLSLADAFRKSGKEVLGKCLECSGNLVLRRSKFGDFIGCDNYPECNFTISIPKGNVKVSGVCRKCGYRKLKLITKGKRRTFEFCINPDCPSKKK
ncbi:MAG: DNA topoisomerase I [Candidatus Altiarchaeales archaeon]|nr:MAG: DNA topoisomerase I [Candidatus Altiarchaeales archaeon]